MEKRGLARRCALEASLGANSVSGDARTGGKDTPIGEILYKGV
jgi:hypothetical protein